MTRATQFFDFNIAVTLISFILSEKWLESRAKQALERTLLVCQLFKFRLLCSSRRTECWLNRG